MLHRSYKQVVTYYIINMNQWPHGHLILFSNIIFVTSHYMLNFIYSFKTMFFEVLHIKKMSIRTWMWQDFMCKTKMYWEKLELKSSSPSYLFQIVPHFLSICLVLSIFITFAVALQPLIVWSWKESDHLSFFY